MAKKDKKTPYQLKAKGDELILTPLKPKKVQKLEWETIFDAKRDNNGKGIPAKKFLALLKKART